MAYFAQLDGNNIVINVIVIDDDNCLDGDGNHSEVVGIAFCKSLIGQNTTWVETKEDGSIRNKYAGIGYTFDATNDVFIVPQPISSWTLNQTTFNWDPPVAYPDDGNHYYWNEATQSWDEHS